MQPDLLISWKEIASYLGRGVRTVQRWEKDLHLPVQRLHGRSRSGVIALKSDIDRWIVSRIGANPHIPQHDDILRIAALVKSNRAEMRSLSHQIRLRVRRMHSLLHNVAVLAASANELMAHSNQTNYLPTLQSAQSARAGSSGS